MAMPMGVSRREGSTGVTLQKSDSEKEALSRLSNSPLKFNKDANSQSESVEERNPNNPERIEVNIADGFDFSESLK